MIVAFNENGIKQVDPNQMEKMDKMSMIKSSSFTVRVLVVWAALVTVLLAGFIGYTAFYMNSFGMLKIEEIDLKEKIGDTEIPLHVVMQSSGSVHTSVTTSGNWTSFIYHDTEKHELVIQSPEEKSCFIFSSEDEQYLKNESEGMEVEDSSFPIFFFTASGDLLPPSALPDAMKRTCEGHLVSRIERSDVDQQEGKEAAASPQTGARAKRSWLSKSWRKIKKTAKKVKKAFFGKRKPKCSCSRETSCLCRDQIIEQVLADWNRWTLAPLFTNYPPYQRYQRYRRF